MEKYYYDFDDCCKETCLSLKCHNKLHIKGVKIGSVSCQLCDCYIDGDCYDKWIICSDIIHAIDKNKLKIIRRHKLKKLNESKLKEM